MLSAGACAGAGVGVGVVAMAGLTLAEQPASQAHAPVDSIVIPPANNAFAIVRSVGRSGGQWPAGQSVRWSVRQPVVCLFVVWRTASWSVNRFKQNSSERLIDSDAKTPKVLM